MKLLIVDHHPLVCGGLSKLLTSNTADLEVLQAEDCVSGTALAARHADLDAIFMDLNLPGLCGPDAVREFGKQCPAVQVIVLSSCGTLCLVSQHLYDLRCFRAFDGINQQRGEISIDVAMQSGWLSGSSVTSPHF
jgi:DNA-binding NtrC family response regulator